MPLPYQPENNDIPVQTPPTGCDALRTLAVSRIYLDNFDHITAYWVGLGLRACLKTTRGAVVVPKAGWRGVTKENTLHGSSTEELRSQAAFGATTLRAAVLLGLGGVGSVVTARCGDAPSSPPCPHPKSLAAAPLVVFNQALKLAQVALSYGADDLHGTIIEEHIFHSAGATSPQLQTEMEMVKAIREAGRTPVQRNTFYEPIKVLPDATAATEAEPPPGKSKVLEDNLATA